MTEMQSDDAADLFRRAPTRYLDVGAGEVACRSVGEGPDVVFVHGWPVSGATWRYVLPGLVDNFRCHVLDLPGAGDSRFGAATPISFARHVQSVRQVVDRLGCSDVAVVGHDSGGLIARHAMAGDPRLRALALVDSEQTGRLTWRFRSFLLARHLPGFGAGLRAVLGSPGLRRHPLVLGGAFVDRKLLDGEFDEFFLAPLRRDPARLRAAVQLLRSFDVADVRALSELHARIEVPVGLVWGERDPFFPVARARDMVATFPRATLSVVSGAALFPQEECPEAVVAALHEVLAG